MPNPPNPINPNITTGAHTGRVVADRYDFEKHITGVDFKHNSSQLVLEPPVDIDSVLYSDVQAAITELATLIIPPVVPDATTGVKGIIRLGGDLAGTGTTALTPKVSGLQGSPVSAAPPTLNQILTWDGLVWGPAAPANAFTASGDLDGDNISQTVAELSGFGNSVKINCGNLTWDAGESNPTIKQVNAPSGDGYNLTIVSQDALQAGQDGGSIVLRAGQPGTGGVYGGVRIEVNTARMVHAVMPATSQRILGLVSNGDVTSTQMPANTGDRVIYIGEASVAPTSGVPVGGAILYAKSNGLWTKSQDGYDFQLGTLPNPAIWGDSTNGQVFEARGSGQTTGAAGATLISKSFATGGLADAIIKVEATYVGKRVGSTDSVIYNLTRGFVTNVSGSPTGIGASASTDARLNGGGSGWNIPAIATSGTTLNIVSGHNTATTINWFVVIRIVAHSVP